MRPALLASRGDSKDGLLAATFRNQPLQVEHGADWAYNLAYVYAWRNERDRAFEWLDKAATQYDPGLVEMAPEPLFTNLHEDPRWPHFLRKLGLAPEQLAANTFDVSVPK